MSMDVGGAKGGVKADINVTPLVDVMLVLLIIVMLVAPMLQNQVEVSMPQASNATDRPDTSDQISVHIDSKGMLFVKGRPQPSQADAIAQLQSVLETATDRTVYLKGDKDAKYGAIMSMMDALRKAGIETVALITAPPPKEGATAQGGQ